MVRTINEESIVCGIMREKYFENPRYRKWSDIIPPSDNSYGDRLEYNFFIDYVMGDDNSRMDAKKIYDVIEQCLPELANELRSEKKSYEYFEDFMESGDLSKIDWPNFYAYVDRVCDEYPYYRNTKFFQAVEKYREQLLNSGYDII